MEYPQHNTGVLIQQPSATDFMAGEQIPYEIVCENWSPSLPDTERQYSKKTDTSGCTSFAGQNCVETQINYFLASGKLSAACVAFLKDNGYILNGKVNFSDRFTAVMAGNTKQGNYVNKVWDSIRHDGLIPETMLPIPGDNYTWEEFHSGVTEEMKPLGKKFLDHFIVQYQWINAGTSDRADQWEAITKAVKQAPIQTAALCMFGNPAKDAGCGTQHSYTIYKTSDVYHNFDTYEPFLFTGEKDFCVPWAGQIIITPKSKVEINIADYEGKVIEAPNGKAYLVEKGKKRWSPDMPTFLAYNLDPAQIMKVTQTVADMIPAGEQLQFNSAPNRAILEQVKKHWKSIEWWIK